MEDRNSNSGRRGTLRRPLSWRAGAVLAAVLLVAALPSLAATMYIDIDGTSSNATTGAATSLTLTHTITRGGGATPSNNAVLIVGIAYSNNNTDEITSVKWNGVDLTFSQLKTTETAGYPTASVWYLVEPSADDNGVIEISATSSIRIAATAVSFVNVKAVDGDPIQATGGNTGSGSIASANNYPNLADSMFFAVTAVNSNNDSTIAIRQATSTTVRGSGSDYVAPADYFVMSAATKATPDPDTLYSVGWNVDVNANTKWATDLVEIRPLDNLTAVRMDAAEAERTPIGAFVRWRTAAEASNLGFNVWREVDGVRRKATPSLIAGSVLLAGAEARLSAGRRYEWFDSFPGEEIDVRYWIEEVDLDGRRNWYGPILPAREASRILDPGELRGGLAMRTPLLDGLVPSAASVAADQRRLSAAAERSAFASLSAGQETLDAQRKLARGRAAKLFVNREGWVRVSGSQLAAAGFSPGAVSRGLQLFSAGVEQPILVNDGGDGRFDGVDSFEFYGVPQDTPWTGERCYWLVDGKGDGLRVGLAAGASAGPSANPTFPFAVERRDRSVYFTALTNNGDEASFFGDAVTSSGVDQEIQVAKLGVAVELDYPLVVSLQGVTKNQKHSVEVSLNGHRLGSVAFKDQQRGVATFRVPPSWIVAGKNVVSLKSEEGSNDVNLVDYIRLTYPHAYAAEDGLLKFDAPASATVSVTGFPSRSVRVFDVSDPLRVTQLPVETTLGADGSVTASVNVSSGGAETRTMIALSDDRLLSPARIVENKPSSWSQNRASATYWILGHGTLLPSVAPLEALRQSQRLKVQSVDVEDLYDEYSFGEKTPYAIRSFLQERVKQGGAPSYVLLVGGASNDPRDFFGRGQRDLVPTKLVPANSTKTAYDGWFVDSSGEGLPMAAVGRLTVQTPAEASAAVAKIFEWEKGLGGGEAWRSRVLHVSDRNDDPVVNPYQFETAIDELTGLVGSPYKVTTLKLGSLGSQARVRLLAELNEGGAFVTYLGHGSPHSWSSMSMFNDADVAALTNVGKSPVVLALNCLNGYFVDVWTRSLGEVFLGSDKAGATAVLASSALTNSWAQADVASAFYTAVFSGSARRLGDAVQAARPNTPDLAVRRSFNLLGDPALRLR